MASTSYEARLILAIQAIRNNPNLRVTTAAELYDVRRTTLTDRLAGRPARCNIPANSRKLTDLEEETIVRYITELCTRSFSPRLSGVRDMANQLLRARDASNVGQRWAHNFVRRRSELRIRFARKYDYQRAKCEDPKIISEWFDLVRNTKAIYGIMDEDIYNFDKTGFMMGMIFAGMVVTTSDGRGRAKLAQPSNRE